jgi:molybdenum cofactor cytidylyltransferase
MAEEALLAVLGPVVVVTGAYAPEVSAELAGLDVQLVYNESWQEGMGLGIVAGLSALKALAPGLKHVIVAVCDQPYVSAELFDQMIERQKETGNGIVACAYADTLGTPVLFGQQYFEDLLRLEGHEGAKVLLKLHLPDVTAIPFPKGDIDIDTEEDYRELKKGKL